MSIRAFARGVAPLGWPATSATQRAIQPVTRFGKLPVLVFLLALAALESVCFQTHDLLAAMQKDWKSASGSTVLRVDGGMVASDFTMQRLADVLNAPVDRPEILETTALGAAWLAAHRVGLWSDMTSFEKSWRRQTRFKPKMPQRLRAAKLDGWHDAVSRTLTH